MRRLWCWLFHRRYRVLNASTRLTRWHPRTIYVCPRCHSISLRCGMRSLTHVSRAGVALQKGGGA